MPRKIKDYTGQVFGKLTVVAQQGKDSRGRSLWLCTCECGDSKVVRTDNLQKRTRSCGKPGCKQGRRLS